MDVATLAQLLAAITGLLTAVGGGVVWLMRRRDRHASEVEAKTRELEAKVRAWSDQVDADNDELRAEADRLRGRYARMRAIAWGYVGQMRKAGLAPDPPEPEHEEGGPS